MLPRVNPTKTKAWKALEAHAAATADALAQTTPNNLYLTRLNLQNAKLNDK